MMLKFSHNFFATNESFDLPFLPKDLQIASINENRSFHLPGSLCFFKVYNISEESDCIMLYNQSAAWFDIPEGHTTFGYTVQGTWLDGWWPKNDGEDLLGITIQEAEHLEKPPKQPHWAPFCFRVNKDSRLLPWTGCQDRGIMG